MASTYLRLRPDASVETLPVNATFWQRISSGALGDFHHEYLVSCHTFDSDWTMWERHPVGDEVVCLLAGAVTFLLEHDGSEEAIELRESGAYLIVPKGVWHTATVSASATVLLFTAGEGTQHRATG